MRKYSHPPATGIASLVTSAADNVAEKVSFKTMLRAMVAHIWPKDKPELRMRVVLAASLLIGAKVCIDMNVLQYFYKCSGNKGVRRVVDNTLA